MKTRVANVTSSEVLSLGALSMFLPKHVNLNAKDCAVFKAIHAATHSFFFHLNVQLRNKAGQSLIKPPRLVFLIVSPLTCICWTAENHRFGLLIVMAMRGEITSL